MSVTFATFLALPLAAVPLVYLAGHLRVNHSRTVALLVLLLDWYLFVMVARDFSGSGPAIVTVGHVTMRFDGLSLLIAALVLTLGTLAVVFSGTYLRAETSTDKYYALLLAMISAMIGLTCAVDLFNLWLWFELMTISSYLLVTFYRSQPASLEAGVKYLIQSAVGSTLILLAIALVLMQTSSIDMDVIRVTAGSAPVFFLAAGALFVIGFGVKAALVPLHTWLPDAHSQAPSGISAMLSGVVIETGLIALLRVLTALVGVTTSWGVLLMGFGALNMILGNLMALRQTQIKRLLAYSSVSHVGYMLLGLGIGLYADQAYGIQGGLFHLLNHGLMKGLAFLSAGALLYALHLASAKHTPLTINDLSGASQRYPLVAFTFSLAVLALGGLPPLAGFMSKWQIFTAGFMTQNLAIEALVIFAALNSVLSLAYYAPLVNAVYRRQPSIAVQHGQPIPFTMNLPLVVLAILVIAIGIWPSLVSGLTGPAGTAILAVFSR